MKLQLTNPNAKGQIVIPKVYRDALQISQHTVLAIQLQGKKVVIQPVKSVNLSDSNNKSNYLRALKHTKGTWEDSDYQNYQAQRKLEKKKAQLARNAW